MAIFFSEKDRSPSSVISQSGVDVGIGVGLGVAGLGHVGEPASNSTTGHNNALGWLDQPNFCRYTAAEPSVTSAIRVAAGFRVLVGGPVEGQIKMCWLKLGAGRQPAEVPVSLH